MHLIRLSFLSILLVLLTASPASAEKPLPVYIFPVQFQKDMVATQEQNMFEEVVTEEMGALFWMETLTTESIADELGDKLANRVKRCKNPKCAFKVLRKAKIKRVLFIRVKRLKRRTFEITSSVIGKNGKAIFKHSEIERGGQSELKYAAAGIVEQLFKKEIEAHSDRITSIVETTAVTSTDADSTIEKAAELSAEGNDEKALAQYRLAAENSPNLALPLIKIAELELKNGNTNQALDAAEKALEIETSNPQALMIKAEILIAKGLNSQAEKPLRAAISKDDKLINAYFLLAEILSENGQNGEALTLLTRADKLAPNQPEIQVNLGKIHLQLGRLNNAITALEKAVELNPDLLAAYPPLAETYEQQKQYRKAMDCFDTLFLKMPDCAACAYNLARMEEQQNSLKQAEEHYKKAIELDEYFVDAYYNLGEMLISKGKAKEAVGWLKQYVEKETRSDQSRYVRRARKLIKKHSS